MESTSSSVVVLQVITISRKRAGLTNSSAMVTSFGPGCRERLTVTTSGSGSNPGGNGGTTWSMVYGPSTRSSSRNSLSRGLRPRRAGVNPDTVPPQGSRGARCVAATERPGSSPRAHSSSRPHRLWRHVPETEPDRPTCPPSTNLRLPGTEDNGPDDLGHPSQRAPREGRVHLPIPVAASPLGMLHDHRDGLPPAPGHTAALTEKVWSDFQKGLIGSVVQALPGLIQAAGSQPWNTTWRPMSDRRRTHSCFLRQMAGHTCSPRRSTRCGTRPARMQAGRTCDGTTCATPALCSLPRPAQLSPS